MVCGKCSSYGDNISVGMCIATAEIMEENGKYNRAIGFLQQAANTIYAWGGCSSCISNIEREISRLKKLDDE